MPVEPPSLFGRAYLVFGGCVRQAASSSTEGASDLCVARVVREGDVTDDPLRQPPAALVCARATLNGAESVSGS